MPRAPKLTPFLNMLAGAAVLAGCNLSVDTSLIRQDAGGDAAGELEVESELDGGQAPEPELDADESPDRGQDAKVEAGGADAAISPGPWYGDSARPDVDATPGPNPVTSCDDDDDCAAQDYCAFAGCSSTPPCARACRARCLEPSGCAGPQANAEELVVGMAASGETLYWSTPPDRDTLGNLLNGGRIWSWRRSTPASVPVERESGELLLIADDYLYFRRPTSLGAPPSALFRKSLGGQDSPATQLATDVVNAWKTAVHVVWARKEGSTEELWRLSRTSAAPAERIAVSQTGHWSSSNSTLAIKSLALNETGNIPSVRFTAIRLSDQMEVGSVVTGFSDNARSEADEDYLYFQRDNGIRRAPFANLSQDLIIARVMEVGVAQLEFELDGSWIYWSTGSDSGRSQRDLMVNPPEKLVASGPVTARIKNELFYFNDRHIFYKSMMQLPCSPAMACPADMTCSASMICE